jgi:hypothetical protein
MESKEHDGKRNPMSWNRIRGRWKQHQDNIIRQVHTLLKDDLASIAGRYQDHLGRLRQKYRIARKDAVVEVEAEVAGEILPEQNAGRSPAAM